MKRVTNDDIKTFNKLYLKLKTYAAVSRATGFAPSTIKKYIIPDYKDPSTIEIVRFNKPLPEFDCSKFFGDDWGTMCELSEEEVKEIKELWKEIEL